MPTSSSLTSHSAPVILGRNDSGFNDQASVVFDRVTKRYPQNSNGVFSGALRDDIAAFAGRIIRPWRTKSKPLTSPPVLDQLSLRIGRGENVGVIGANAAGKTTLLKLICKITRPTQGQLFVAGKTAPMIELSAGFHPDLSGSENIFLYGAILGLTKHEVKERMGDIIAFSELEDFLDLPLKKYSSGMALRLGFSVAVHAEPDILLIDEVLTVGDQAFQEKCLAHMKGITQSKTTLLFVSHQRELIEKTCDRVLYIENGQLAADGKTEEVFRRYNEKKRVRVGSDPDT